MHLFKDDNNMIKFTLISLLIYIFLFILLRSVESIISTTAVRVANHCGIVYGHQ